MLIQNVNNSTVAAYQPDRHAGDGVSASAVSSAAATVEVKEVKPSVPASQAVQVKPSPEQLQGMVEGINKTLQQSASKNLEFSIDPGTKEPLVRLVDKETGDVIRQFPSEATLAISKSIGQYQERLQQSALGKETPPSTPSVLLKQRA